MSDPLDSSSPDAYIQQIQRQRAGKIKRVFAGLGIIVGLVVIVALFLGLKSEQDQNLPNSAEAIQQSVNDTYDQKAQEAARESFKQALADFESRRLEILNMPAFQRFDASAYEAIVNEQEQALSLFANAAFIQALGAINEADASADAAISKWKQAFDEKLAQAEAFYQTEQISQARLALSQAQRIRPNQRASESLKARLSVYNEVSELLEALQVARVENNLEKQVGLMQEVLALDPSRSALKAPLSEALDTLNEERLALALSRGREALESGDIATAKTYIQQARKIRSDAPGLQSLVAGLNQRLSQQSLSVVQDQVRQYMAQDAWVEALQSAQRGLANFSSDASLLEAKAKATQILQAQKQLQSFITRPKRLSDANIRNAAQNALQANLVLLPQSNTLSQYAKSLSALLDEYSQEVTLTIMSDEETFIEVLGVGRVGKIAQRSIELKPGRYTLQGSRAGYRSVRESIELIIGQPMQITLICQEEI